MPDNNKVTNVIIAGLGGQGVLKASDILCRPPSPPDTT